MGLTIKNIILRLSVAGSFLGFVGCQNSHQFEEIAQQAPVEFQKDEGDNQETKEPTPLREIVVDPTPTPVKPPAGGGENPPVKPPPTGPVTPPPPPPVPPTPPPVYEKVQEVFLQQPGDSAVDILFVVDNSPSMSDDQKELGEKFPTFLKSLENVDFQIGITTTDTSDDVHGIKGDLVQIEGFMDRKTFLTRGTPDIEKHFLDTIQRKESRCGFFETCATSDEEPLRASMLAVEKRDGVNRGFFRSKADLAVVIISDEDELSNGPLRATRPQQVLDYYNSVWGATKETRFFGIMIEPGDSDCLNSQDRGDTVYYGNLISQLVHLSHKAPRGTGSICADDFSPILKGIGEDIQKLVSVFNLKQAPIAGSLKVKFQPHFVTTWSLNGNRLTFDTAPPSGTIIDIEYDVDKK